MIDYLYGSKSIGVRNYTHELSRHMSGLDLDIRMCGVGGYHVLSQLDQQQLREHLISCIPDTKSKVLHIQHDTLMFRGSCDQTDEIDNLCWFLDMMTQKYDKVCITFHSRIEFGKPRWIEQPINRLLYNILDKQWCNQLIPMLNKCVVLVHSMSHVHLLESQGCNTVQLFTHPTDRYKTIKEPDIENVRVVVPGQLASRKHVGQAIEVCTRIPNCTLTIDSSDMSVYKQWEHAAAAKQVKLKPVKWSINNTEYLKQLCQHDVALVMYVDDVPLSGSVIDALRCGMIVGTTATPSFQWFAKEFRCVTAHDDLHMLGDAINTQLCSTLDRAQSAWHADNYFSLSHESADELSNTYQGTHKKNQSRSYRNLIANVVTESSQQISGMPSYMTNTSECENLRHVDGMLHVEHQYRHNKKPFSRSWSGLIHGPFIETENTLSRPTVNQMLVDNIFSTCTKIQVTNSKLKKQIEPYVPCPVELLKMTGFPPVVHFDLEAYMSQKKHILLHAGWWCKNFESFNSIQLSNIWSKKLHVNKLDPTHELFDMVSTNHAHADICSSIPENCVYYVDQTTDDVVDEQMLSCIRSKTPILIRRNATVEEFLGADYPLLFDTICQASELLTDDNIEKATQFYT